MIKLKNMLKEMESNLEFTYSWQKPDGTFLPVNYSHGSHAYEIMLKKSQGKDFDHGGDHIMGLWKLGWQRITSIRPTGIYANNEVMAPNNVQKKALIDLAIELNYQKVEWDGGDKDAILWTSHDTLEEEKFT